MLSAAGPAHAVKGVEDKQLHVRAGAPNPPPYPHIFAAEPRQTSRRGRLAWGWTMGNLDHPLQDDDIYISEELIARLHGAAESTVLELVGAFQANERANLAMHCYRKSHLRHTGLTIASTCDETTLIHVCGPLRGQAIFAQSRACADKPTRVGRGRPAISIACCAGGSYPPLVDVEDEVDIPA
jgi:hypothetical protein